MSYADPGIKVRDKELATDSFSADVLTTTDIGCRTDVESGTVVTATWANPGQGEHGWYVETRDPHGAVHYSPVNLLTLRQEPGTDPTDPTDNPGPGNGNSGSGQTPAPGTGQVPGSPGTAGPGANTGAGNAAVNSSEPERAHSGNTGGTLASTGVRQGWLFVAGAGVLLLAAGTSLRFAKRDRSARR